MTEVSRYYTLQCTCDRLSNEPAAAQVSKQPDISHIPISLDIPRARSSFQWARMRRATQRQRGQLDGSVATQQPTFFTFTSSEASDYTPVEKVKKLWEHDGVNIARALRSRSPRTFSTLSSD
ncbi:hypothetical protein IRJ41_021453 [Triplophysa rosa]|uniref:Uncharacterized protein n=1 Tax=Triplophysa rosa TaxID=992332 RepID=A0A9W7TJU3_TRIRA|nr:hypothetical protein IRJ41_021453 [Triplophysa rosa]